MKGAALMASAALIASGYIQAQTPGQVPIFDQQGTGACNSAGGNDCIDSVITQASGNIGIGTTTPAAKLDVVGGNFNLENSTATSGSILKGGALFLHNFGYLNTFLGVNAGNMTMTGGFNTASGMEALQSNTSGYQNTAGGYNVLRSNTTGFSNTATGFIALQFNTTGYGNTAFGDNALNQNTTGHQNRPLGYMRSSATLGRPRIASLAETTTVPPGRMRSRATALAIPTLPLGSKGSPATPGQRVIARCAAATTPLPGTRPSSTTRSVTPTPPVGPVRSAQTLPASETPV